MKIRFLFSAPVSGKTEGERAENRRPFGGFGDGCRKKISAVYLRPTHIGKGFSGVVHKHEV